MIRSLRHIEWAAALPRMLADLVIVHMSMVTALAVSVMYQTASGNHSEAAWIIAGFAAYYANSFLPLSLLFPCGFLLGGFYTHSRGYRDRYKPVVIAKGVGLTVLLFLAITLLLLRNPLLPRSVAIPFGVLSALGVAGARVLKSLFVRRVERKLNSGDAASGGRESVLVVGGAGYVGSLLVEALLRNGRKVRVLDNLLYGDASLRGLREHPDLELVVGDCRNIQDVVTAVKGMNSIVDLGAIVGDPACEHDHRTAIETNYAATRMLLEIAKGNKVKRLVFASTCSVYGAAEWEVDERSEVNPVSLYARTKIDSEEAVLSARTVHFHPTVLRLATVFGLSRRPRFDLVVNLLSARACRDHVITIFNGEQWRPFIHVRDVVRAMLAVLDAPLGVVSGEIFNVGDSSLNYTLLDVGRIIRNLIPSTRVETVDNLDRRNYRVSFDKIRRLLDFQCLYRLEDGIREIAASIEQGQVANYMDEIYHNCQFLEKAGSPPHRAELDGRLMAAFAQAPAVNGKAFVVGF